MFRLPNGKFEISGLFSITWHTTPMKKPRVTVQTVSSYRIPPAHRDASHSANERHCVSLRSPIVRGLSLFKQQERDMTNEIRELNIDELDTVSGGGIISTALNVVSATAELIGGVAAAYLNGVAEYGHHLA
jgi:hypothetical protein